LFLSVLHTLQQFITATAEKTEMLWTIAVLLLILWLLGMVSSYTLGGFIHILLILAVVAILIRIIQGRSPV
jgi:asparagine N-glycosylation enzyme membrane subunit Stt3